MNNMVPHTVKTAPLSEWQVEELMEYPAVSVFLEHDGIIYTADGEITGNYPSCYELLSITNINQEERQ